MKLVAPAKFAAHGGKQKPEAFVGGEPLILESVWSNIGTEYEQTGLTPTELQTNEEKLAISTLE
jgi:hypothetical protein